MQRLYLAIVCLLICLNAMSQCINTFPYVADFEGSTQGWFTGGVKDDWAWGAPNKPYITHAGSGSDCWITGGLTVSFYKYGERSYVQSPCFDFTNLLHPYIQFLIFWQSERDFDGTNLQYSLDGGTTWTNVGDVSDVNDCLNAHWYNEASIKYMAGDTILEQGVTANPANAWCGNDSIVGEPQGICHSGDGLHNWVTAKHCMANLAGKPDVTFRFTFGAGTTCNSYDGVAFDSVAIGEAPVNSGTFTATCIGQNEFKFVASPTLCPDDLYWNFDDPNSGSSNTTGGATGNYTSVTHIFSGSGRFNISLAMSGPCNAPDTVSDTVDILKVTSVTQNESCAGDSIGYINLTVAGGNSAYNYNWGGGIISQNRTGLGVGIYTVTVSDSQSCPVVLTDTVTQIIIPLSAMAIANPDTIIFGDTSLIAVSVVTNATGLSYSWTPLINIATPTDSSTHVWPPNTTTYTVNVSSALGCADSAKVTVTVIFPNGFAMPTAFTPGSSTNNTYYPYFPPGQALTVTDFHIYDRWGALVYNGTLPWDGKFKGKDQPPGTYVYYIVIRGYNENGSAAYNRKEGSFVLLR